MHCGYVVKVTELRKHSNADRLQVATFFGNDTIVDLSVKVGDIGVYFPVDLQLSEEYCAKNNLVRKKDENGMSVVSLIQISAILKPSSCVVRSQMVFTCPFIALIIVMQMEQR